MASVRIHNHFNSRYNLGAFRLVFALAIFFFSVESWGACVSGSYSISGNSSISCYYGTTCSGQTMCSSVLGQCNTSICKDGVQYGNQGFLVGAYPASSTQRFCTNDYGGCTSTTNVNRCYYNTLCDTKCEADSIYCKKNGFLWDSQNCRCDDPSICAADKKKCQDFGGTWSGGVTNVLGELCCSSYCNICNSPRFKELKQKKINLCCQKGFAPPADSLMCAPAVVQSGCGMSTAQLNTNAGAWSCIAPNDAQSMAQYNQMCLDSTSNDPNSSGSEGGDGSSSSGEGGGGSSAGPQYPEGCDECPWLDSILDTLTRQKHKVDDIYDCIVMPAFCNVEGEQVQFDTSLLPYLRPYMDSSLRLDSNQIRILQMIDSNFLKFMSRDSIGRSLDSIRFKIDSAMLKSDSVTRQVIIGGLLRGDSVTDALNDSTRKWLRRLADSLGVLNDSTRKYYGYLADSIGVSVDSLINHIDSIKNNIPKDVFDSILKYQKLLSESNDSIVVSSMPSLDSLIDSSLKYWRAGIEYDSVRSGRINDSISKVIDQLDNMALRMSYILGYGDTASTNLRGDLDGIKDGITDFRDSAIKYLSNISIDGDYQGAVTSGLESIGNSVDGLPGRIANSIDSALSAHGGGSVDTSGVHMDIFGGELLADSIARDIGYDKINVGRDTSAMDSIERLGYVETDSTLCVGSECITYASDSRIADSAQRFIAVQGDSLRASNAAFYKDSVDVMFQEVKDTLSKWNPFGMFDSTLMKTLGAKVPNSNTCPEHCSKYRVDIPFIFANLGIDLDWQLCASWAVLGGQNVMSFLRFIIRVIVAVTCIAMVMNAAANTKVK